MTHFNNLTFKYCWQKKLSFQAGVQMGENVYIIDD